MNLKGQSLIELIITLTVITVGLTAGMIFIISNIRLQEVAEDRVVAMNLAREGVEYAKALRDSNWLAGAAFNAGMFLGSGAASDYSAIPYVSTAGVFQNFDFTPDAMSDSGYTKIVRSSAAASLGQYIQGAPGGVPVAGTATPFFRFMQFGPICADGTNVIMDGADCTGHGMTVGVHVTSTVIWTKRGTMRQSVIVDELYDWK